MGMHIGLVAAKTTVPQLRAAFLRAWPEYELVESADHLADPQAAQEWQDAQQQFVTADEWSADNPEKLVFIFWADGPWAAFMDESYVLAADDEGLARLSAQVGTVIAFVVESASGGAFFRYCENGRLLRSISNFDTRVIAEGEALPQEAGIDVGKYYMQETEQLAKAFGLCAFEEMPTSNDLSAICVIDRTDYSDVVS